MRLFTIIITALCMGLAAYSILKTLSTPDKKAGYIMLGMFCVAVMCAIGAALLWAWICR
jgi:hypothetical protein